MRGFEISSPASTRAEVLWGQLGAAQHLMQRSLWDGGSKPCPTSIEASPFFLGVPRCPQIALPVGVTTWSAALAPTNMLMGSFRLEVALL